MRTLKRNFYFSLRQITFSARACTGVRGKQRGKFFNAVRPVHPVDINESRGYAAGQITRLIVDTKFYLCLSVKSSLIVRCFAPPRTGIGHGVKFREGIYHESRVYGIIRAKYEENLISLFPLF